MSNEPGRPQEALRPVQRPPKPGPGTGSDQWVREQLRRTADKPAQVATPAREEPPAPVLMPVESLRPGAIPAEGTRTRDPNEQFRDMLDR